MNGSGVDFKTDIFNGLDILRGNRICMQLLKPEGNNTGLLPEMN
jgi:hypothetical protein